MISSVMVTRAYCRFAPSKEDPGSSIPIVQSIMRRRDAIWWDLNIQPALVSETTRADQFWSWTFIRQVLPLVQKIKGRRCLALVTQVQNAEGFAVPAAMHLLIERYAHLDVRTSKQAEFLWFLAAAPGSVLQRLGVTSPPSLGRISVDAAIVASFLSGTDGRIGLHCAQKGGARLAEFYEKKCRLLRLPSDAKLPISRANDGRFFYTDEMCAIKLAATLDSLR